MQRLNRGNLLATIKELKKHKRPKPAITSVAVQAICPQKSFPKKSVDMQAVAERRKILQGRRSMSSVPIKDIATFMQQYDTDFAEFCDLLKTTRKSVKTASNDISEPA